MEINIAETGMVLVSLRADNFPRAVHGVEGGLGFMEPPAWRVLNGTGEPVDSGIAEVCGRVVPGEQILQAGGLAGVRRLRLPPARGPAA